MSVRRALFTVILAVVALVAPTSASQAAVAGSLSLSVRSSPALPGETVAFRGRVYPVQSGRVVSLQRLVGRTWRSVGTSRTDRSGYYSFGSRAPGRGRYSYRVYAPSTAQRPRVISPARGVVVVSGVVTASTPTSVTQGARITVAGSFTPARPGRAVQLQQQSATGWVRVASGRLDTYSRYALSTSARTLGSTALRVVVAAANGSAATASARRTVSVVPLTSYLSEMSAASGYFSLDRSEVVMNGTHYAKSVYLQGYGATNRRRVEYDLGRNWRTFEATVGMTDTSYSGEVALVDIFVDDRAAERVRVRLGQPAVVNVNVTDAQRLRLEFTAWDEGGSQGSYFVAFGDARVSTHAPATGPVMGPAVTPISDRSAVSTSFDSNRTVSLSGEHYAGGLIGACYGTCIVNPQPGQSAGRTAEYDLGRAFKRFTATWGLDDLSAAGTTTTVRILGDGVLLFTGQAALGQALPLDLDVTGVLRLRIEADIMAPSGRYGYIDFGDARLLS